MKKVKFILMMIVSFAIITTSSSTKINAKPNCAIYPDPPVNGWSVSDFPNVESGPSSLSPCLPGWIGRILSWLGIDGPKGGGPGGLPPYDMFFCSYSQDHIGKICHTSGANPGETLAASHACSTITSCMP